jgi:hypothetical protein
LMVARRRHCMMRRVLRRLSQRMLPGFLVSLVILAKIHATKRKVWGRLGLMV